MQVIIEFSFDDKHLNGWTILKFSVGQNMFFISIIVWYTVKILGKRSVIFKLQKYAIRSTFTRMPLDMYRLH